MVGRDQELALLITLADRVAEERAPQVVTLLGVAGVGKTRLLDELAGRVSARVLRGRCIPYGEGVAYWPLAEVAKAEAGILDSDSAAESLEKLRAAFGADSEGAVQAAAWTIGLDTGSIEVDSDVVRRRLHDHWTRYLATAAAAGPVLLVIEDIHWASTEMLDLLERLATRLEDAPVMILCSSRPELLESRRSWGAGLPNATTVSLTPLRAEQARRLLAELLELGRMPDDALERILARAEGNPFYIEEILRMLIDRGAIERTGSGWRSTDLLADMPIPDSVHGVIAARIDLLDAPSRDALRRCSVIGRRFWPDAVGVSTELVAGIGGGLVAESAESAMGAMREFSYRHALTRDVAYSSLSRPERRELHVQVADWIVRLSAEQGREDSELIADHLHPRHRERRRRSLAVSAGGRRAAPCRAGRAGPRCRPVGAADADARARAVRRSRRTAEDRSADRRGGGACQCGRAGAGTAAAAARAGRTRRRRWAAGRRAAAAVARALDSGRLRPSRRDRGASGRRAG